MFFSYSVESGVIYLFQHLGFLISHSPGSFFRTVRRGLWKKQGSSINSIVISAVHSYQTYKIENTNGTQAEGASPAPFGCSNVLTSWRKYQKRKALLSSGLMCLYKDAYILTKLGCFPVSPLPCTIPAPPPQRPSFCKQGSTKKACLLETDGPFSPCLPLPLI